MPFSHLLNNLNSKFTKDVLWTLSGRLSIGISGILINILVGNHYGAEGLGIFNQAVAVYMIARILSVFGIDNSVLKHTAEFHYKPIKLTALLSSSLSLVFVSSSVLTVGTIVFINQFGDLLNNKPLVQALRIIILALPLFSLNKILAAFLNGQRRMKYLSVIQSSRWYIIIAFLVFSIINRKDHLFILYSFIVSELLIFTFLIIDNFKHIDPLKFHLKNWGGKHLQFGGKTLIASAINEINRRVDVLMIGYFMTNEAAGIYSFAATAARGFFLLGSAIQTNFNPIVSKLWAQRELDRLRTCFIRIKKSMLFIVAPLLGIALCIYPFAVDWFMENPAYGESTGTFYILIVGVSLMVVFNWSGGILTMAGFVNETLKISTFTVLFNIIANAFLIPIFGINGAAFATTLSFITRLWIIRYFVKEKIGVRIF